MGNVGSTIGFIGMGLFLESMGFILPFILRAIVYVLAALLIYMKLKD
jgi:hypothetical protein